MADKPPYGARQRIYQSPFSSFEIPTNSSISQFLQQTNPDDVPSDKPILSDFDNPSRVVTFGGLRDQASRGAAGLRAFFDLKVGDLVCIVGLNSVNWALLAHSTLWAGGCFSAINPLATSFELVHCFEITKPSIIGVDAALLPTVYSALEKSELRLNPRLLVIDDDTKLPKDLPIFPSDIITSRSPPLSPYDLSKSDNRAVPAGMIFSSGTSGKPKGVVLSHYNLIAYLLTMRASNPFMHNGSMREAFFPSFAHVYGVISAVLLSPYVGSYVVAMRRYDFLSYLERCAQIKATILRLVPSTALRMVKDPAVKKLDLRSIRMVMCSGAALSTETSDELQNMLGEGVTVHNGFGMSEGTVTMLRELWTVEKAGSVGKLAAGVSVRVVDDNRNDVQQGEDGECLVRGPTVFLRYKDNPKETAETFHDGWLCTGDVVRVDKDGFFWLTGRKKELIKYKGNQIAPAELEAVLLSHPLVADAGVCGVYDQTQDTELPLACVSFQESVQAKDHEKLLIELKAFVDDRVAPYKRLRGGLFHLESLPKGSTGKLLRREIPEKLEESRSRRAKL